MRTFVLDPVDAVRVEHELIRIRIIDDCLSAHRSLLARLHDLLIDDPLHPLPALHIPVRPIPIHHLDQLQSNFERYPTS